MNLTITLQGMVLSSTLREINEQWRLYEVGEQTAEQFAREVGAILAMIPTRMDKAAGRA